MGRKKQNFDTIDTTQQTAIRRAISSATGTQGIQQPASPEEKAARAATMKTQGRKGCKASRINMAFSTQNYGFIQTMARVHGMTMTKYLNAALDEYRAAHDLQYQRALLFVREMQMNAQTAAEQGKADTEQGGANGELQA